MADSLDRLKGLQFMNPSDQVMVESISAELTRLRALEAKVKELLAMLGQGDSLVDLMVPLAFRDLKDEVNKGYKETRAYLNKTLTPLRDLGAEDLGMQPIRQGKS